MSHGRVFLCLERTGHMPPKNRLSLFPGIPDQWDIILRVCSSPHFFLSGKTSPSFPPTKCVYMCVGISICLHTHTHTHTHDSYRLLAKQVGNWKLTLKMVWVTPGFGETMKLKKQEGIILQHKGNLARLKVRSNVNALCFIT